MSSAAVVIGAFRFKNFIPRNICDYILLYVSNCLLKCCTNFVITYVYVLCCRIKNHSSQINYCKFYLIFVLFYCAVQFGQEANVVLKCLKTTPVLDKCIHLNVFCSQFFQRGTTIVTSYLLPWREHPFQKGFYS